MFTMKIKEKLVLKKIVLPNLKTIMVKTSSLLKSTKKKSFRSLVILRLFNVIGIFNKKFKPFTFKKENYQRLIFKILQNFKNNQNTNINFVTKKNKKKLFPQEILLIF